MARESDRHVLADDLASALVLSDLADAEALSTFTLAVEEAAASLASDGDGCAIATIDEVRRLIARLCDDDIDPDEATQLIGEQISALFDLPIETPATEPEKTVSADGEDDQDAAGNLYAQDPTVINEFVSSAREQLDDAEAALSSEATGGHVDVDAVFRCFHTLKGIAGFLALDDMAAIAHDAETLLEPLRSGDQSVSEEAIASALVAVDRIRGLVLAIDLDRKTDATPAARRESQTVRVDARRLEDLLDALGELVVAEAEVAQAVLRLADDTAERSVEKLGRIARQMQASATSLRMVSLAPTFRKMSRVVRDMVAKSGKRVNFEVSGGETELDRAIVEGIADPLVHLLRNALDHGIEAPSARRAAGKPEVGRVELRAFHRSGSVHIEVADDGRGIDVGHLTEKASALGVAADAQDPLSLIFCPGLSTAETVTEISGRGVGMDAVATAVAALRGQIDVQSTVGSGTVVSIRLPLTLALIDGIVLSAGSERYVVPTEFVERTVRIDRSQIVSAAGRGDVLVLDDGPIAVFPITAPMGGDLAEGRAAVIIRDLDDHFALLVDQVHGQQNLVIKALSGPVAHSAGIAGAALMGDGKAVLVIDPFGLSKAVRGVYREGSRADVRATQED